jgi:2-amino-4-hydroxy-6-hydroxymethyldihydropteridine diphosphokinase
VIVIAIGSNLAAPPATTPRETAEAALLALRSIDIRVIKRSGWYLTKPIPASDQPWFINGVAIVESELDPPTLLARLLKMETDFARVRSVRNAARTLDLDLLDHDSCLCDTVTLTLPHPRLHERRFVLAPLCEIAAHWRHPRLGLTASELLARLPTDQTVRRLED